MSGRVTRRGLVQAGAAVLGAVSLPAAAVALESVLPAPASPDAALVALIDRHGIATAEWNAIGIIRDDLWSKWISERPEYPSALEARTFDSLGVRPQTQHLSEDRTALIYDPARVEQLRAVGVPTRWNWVGTQEQWTSNDPTGWAAEPCPKKIARRTEILAAYDTWKAECDALSDQIGLTAVQAQNDAAGDLVEGVEMDILAHQPRTLAGFAAKARWIEAQHSTEDWAGQIVQDLCALGEVA